MQRLGHSVNVVVRSPHDKGELKSERSVSLLAPLRSNARSFVLSRSRSCFRSAPLVLPILILGTHSCSLMVCNAPREGGEIGSETSSPRSEGEKRISRSEASLPERSTLSHMAEIELPSKGSTSRMSNSELFFRGI